REAATPTPATLPRMSSCPDSVVWFVSGSIVAFIVAGRLQPPGLAQRVAQHVLDLCVEAAQLIVGPALRRRQDLGVDAQRIGLLFGHLSTASRCSRSAGSSGRRRARPAGC